MLSLSDINQKWGVIISVIALPVLIYIGNPAIALIFAAALSLLLNQTLIPSAGPYGKLALQTAIVLLGLKMDAEMMLTLSADFALIIGIYVLATLGLGLLLGKLLRSESQSSKLVAAGTAICGGTAIASLSPIVRARPEQTAVVMALVFSLNAVALFTFPMLGEMLELTQKQFGVWCAIAIHDTSSVVATAAIYGEEAAEVATTLKLGRTLWLIPLILVYSLVEKAPQARLRVPGFILAFIGASIIGSVVPMPEVVPEIAGWLSKSLLVFALFCIGAEINRSTIEFMKGRVMVQGLLLWALVVPTTLVACILLV